MDLQNIRKYYEYAIIDCCNLARIEYRAENTLEPGGDAGSSFATMRLQFTRMTEPGVGCGPESLKRAFIVVEHFSPKGIGPAAAQDFMECVVCSLHELDGITDIDGPRFSALDNRPYFFATLNAGIIVPTSLNSTT